MDLVGITELARMLSVSRQRASQITDAKGFPKPLGRTASGPVWMRKTIEKWIARNR